MKKQSLERKEGGEPLIYFGRSCAPAARGASFKGCIGLLTHPPFPSTGTGQTTQTGLVSGIIGPGLVSDVLSLARLLQGEKES